MTAGKKSVEMQYISRVGFIQLLQDSPSGTKGADDSLNGHEINSIAIIGAGKTGRGFLARIASSANAKLSFIDKDDRLVQLLNEDTSYTIHFFGGSRKPYRIEGVRAAVAGTKEAVQWLAEADLVFTAVAEQNLLEIAGMLNEAAALRRNLLPEEGPLYVITGENGIEPGRVLSEGLAQDGMASGDIVVAESAVFCSTVDLQGTRLDIQSEAFDELPYDSMILPGRLQLSGMTPEPHFRNLLMRKIYTYNCLSACIAYLGALKDYQWYSDAANDSDIGYVLDRVTKPLNDAIAKSMNLNLQSQQAFSRRALAKFKDMAIRDDIARNARDVMRKLGPEERLLAPMRIIRENNGDLSPLALVVAAACLYRGEREAELVGLLAKGGVETVLAAVGLEIEDPFTAQVCSYYRQLIERRAEPAGFENMLPLESA